MYAVVIFILAGLFAGFWQVEAQSTEDSTLMVWVQRKYSAWENPLHSEFTVNGQTVNIYTSDTYESLATYVKKGWNTVTVKTKPQEPASKDNELIFRIGPMHKDDRRKQMIMEPVLWEFRNGTDWKFQNGTYSHPLGPGVKEVELTFDLFFAGMDLENRELKAGDYILQGKPKYPVWNAPVTATVFINDKPLNSFLLQPRQIVITSFLKTGKNEIKLVSHRVEGSIRNNDIEFSIAGPAEWNVQSSQYLVKPILEFKAMQGWTLDAKTGMLINPLKPDATFIERGIPFILKESPTSPGNQTN